LKYIYNIVRTPASPDMAPLPVPPLPPASVAPKYSRFPPVEAPKDAVPDAHEDSDSKRTVSVLVRMVISSYDMVDDQCQHVTDK